MKSLVLVILTLFCLLAVMDASARDTRTMFSLQDALGNEGAKEKLDGSVRFFSASRNILPWRKNLVNS